MTALYQPHDRHAFRLRNHHIRARVPSATLTDPPVLTADPPRPCAGETHLHHNRMVDRGQNVDHLANGGLDGPDETEAAGEVVTVDQFRRWVNHRYSWNTSDTELQAMAAAYGVPGR